MRSDDPDFGVGDEGQTGVFELKVPERGERDSDATENQRTIIRLLFEEVGITDPRFAGLEKQVGQYQAWPIIQQLAQKFTRLPLLREDWNWEDTWDSTLTFPDRLEDEPDATENQKTIMRALLAELGITEPSVIERVMSRCSGRWQAWQVIEYHVSWFTELRPV